MRSEHAHLSISLITTFVASALGSMLISPGLGGVIGWTLAYLVAGAIVSLVHHRRVHRSMGLDTALLAMSFSLAGFAAELAFILTGAIAAGISSAPPLVMASSIAFVVGLVFVFVLQLVYAFRFEPTHRMLYRALAAGAILAIIALVTVQVVGTLIIHDQLKSEQAFVDTMDASPPGSSTQEYEAARTELANMTLGDALASLETSERTTTASALTDPHGCDAVFIDVSRCSRVVTNGIVTIVDYVIHTLSIHQAYVDAANATASSDPLTTEEISTIRAAFYTEDPKLTSMSAREAMREAQRLSTNTATVSDAQLQLIRPLDANPMGASFARVSSATKPGDALAQLGMRVLSRTDFYRGHRPLIVPALLLSEDPKIAHDPAYIGYARAEIASQDALDAGTAG